MRAILGIVAVSIAFTATPAAAQDSDERRLTAEMAQRVQTATGQSIEVTGPLEMRGKNGDGTEFALYLDRIYQFCATNDAEACEAAKVNYVTGMKEAMAPPPPLRREQLRLAVRDASYCAELDRTMGEAGNPAIHQPLARGLCVVLVADFPRTRRMVTADDLTKLALTRATAWQDARASTLGATYALADIAFDKDAVVLSGGDYLPGILLDTDGWTALAKRAGDALIVTVPSDQFVSIDRASRIEDMEMLRKQTRSSYESAERGISPLVYRWNGSGWSVVE